MAEDYYLDQDDENIPSIIGLQIALIDEVEFVDVNESAKTFGAVNFIAGASFKNIYVTPGKSKLTVNPKSKNGNDYYNVKLVCYHPKERQAAAEVLNEIARRRVLALFKTGNGYNKLIGTDLEPAFITIEPTEQNGYSGYEITIEGDFSQPPLFEA